MAGEKKVSVIIAAIDQVTSRLGTIQRSITNFAGIAARRIKEGLVNLAGRALSGFFTKAIDEATEAELAAARLGGAVELLGVDFASVRPEIDATIERLTALSGRDGEEVSDALANLVTKSKNLASSVRNLPIVLDLAAKEQISLAQASDIVGRAMAGNMRGLKQLGINAKTPLEAIAALRAQYAGFAEREGNTFQGMLGRLKEGWNNVLQEVGTAIISHEGLKGTLSGVIGWLVRLRTWIETNRGEIGYWGTVTLAAGKAIGQTFLALVRVAFNAGTAIGSQFKRIYYAIAVELLKVLNAVPVAINAMIEDVNRLPGVQIRTRLPELSGTIASYMEASDDAAAAAANDMDDIRDAVAGTVIAWEDLGRTARETTREASDAATTATRRISDLGEEVEAAADDARQKALDRRVAMLTTLTESEASRADGLAGLALMEGAVVVQLARGNLTLEQRAQLLERLQRIRKSQGETTTPASPVIPGVDTVAAPAISATDIRASAELGLANAQRPPELDFVDQLKAAYEDLTGSAERADIATQGIGTTLGDIAGGALGTFVGTWQEGMQAIADGSQSVGEAVLSSTRKAIAGGVQAKGAETMIDAGKAAIQGLTSPVKLVQAAGLFAKATAYFGLASALGGGGGGGSRGGGGGGRAAAQRDSEALANIAPRRGTIIIQGGLLNMDDPRQRRELKEAIQALGETRDIDVVVSR